MNTRTELSILSEMYKLDHAATIYKHATARNTLRSDYYAEINGDEHSYKDQRDELDKEILELRNKINAEDNLPYRLDLNALISRRMQLARDYEKTRHEKKLKLKNALLASSLDESVALARLESNYSKRRLAVLSKSNEKGGQNE